MDHRQKQRLARRMRTQTEIINRTPVFETQYWENRKKKIKKKFENRKKYKRK